MEELLLLATERTWC